MLHSWMCQEHRGENEPLLAAHMKEMGRNVPSYTFLTRSPPLYSPIQSETTSTATPARQSQIEYILADNPHQRAHQTSPREDDNTHTPIITIDEREECREPPMSKVLTELKDRTPVGEELITKLMEPPLFIFSSTPGRDSDVMIFYDGGNSHCLFDQGTPDNLYGIKLSDWPYPLGAVGATMVYGGDSWICQ